MSWNTFGWLAIDNAPLLFFSVFSSLYGTFNVLLFFPLFIDGLMCILFIENVHRLWRLSVNDHTGKEYTALAQPQSINRKCSAS